ncbi:MAG: hypothetical protein IT269_01805 [Saprospiraceae bacterium]|nr:hypothetical protein [Saprospiraceae bacterium]
MKQATFFTLAIWIGGAACWLGLPWWSIAIVAAIAAMLFTEGGVAVMFGKGFLAGSTLWYFAALWQDVKNASLLSAKIGELFMGLKTAHLLMATGFMGGLLAGLGAVAGFYLKLLLFPPKKRRYQHDPGKYF